MAAEREMNEVVGGASDESPIYGLIYRRALPREQTTREQFAGSGSPGVVRREQFDERLGFVERH